MKEQTDEAKHLKEQGKKILSYSQNMQQQQDQQSKQLIERIEQLNKHHTDHVYQQKVDSQLLNLQNEKIQKNILELNQLIRKQNNTPKKEENTQQLKFKPKRYNSMKPPGSNTSLNGPTLGPNYLSTNY